VGESVTPHAPTEHGTSPVPYTIPSDGRLDLLGIDPGSVKAVWFI
jgi:hypothetical protein